MRVEKGDKMSEVKMYVKVNLVTECKDCKYWEEVDLHGSVFHTCKVGVRFNTPPNWYCADGEEKEETDRGWSK